MIRCKLALLMSWLAAPLVLAAGDASARACRSGHAVELTIQLEPPEAGLRRSLEQRLAAELRARGLGVCTPAGNEQGLIHVSVAAPAPGLSPTSVQVRTAGGKAVERQLDVAALPVEARPSAIASATDELVSALLQSAAAPPAGGDTAASAAPASDATATLSAQGSAWKVPRLELGLGGGGALFQRQSAAYRGELLARWRPLSRLSATLRVGGDHRLTEETPWFDPTTGRRIADSASGWHAGLDAGFELTEPAEGLGLTAVAGLALARLELSEEWPEGSGAAQPPAVSAWELAANLGGEVSYRARGWGIDLALSLLVPFTPRERNWGTWENGREPEQAGPAFDSLGTITPPGAGFGEQLGGQLDVRLWVALDS